MKDFVQRHREGERACYKEPETYPVILKAVKEQDKAFHKMLDGRITVEEYKKVVKKREEIEKDCFGHFFD